MKKAFDLLGWVVIIITVALIVYMISELTW